MKIASLIERIRKAVKQEGKVYDATKAYQMAKYNDNLTKDQLREELIERLNRRIISDTKISGKLLDITTYDGYREKILLPEIAEFFRGLNYHVDLLNDGEYKDINVLIINWQSKETFK